MLLRNIKSNLNVHEDGSSSLNYDSHVKEDSAALKVMLAKISNNLQKHLGHTKGRDSQTPRPGAPVWALAPKCNMLVRMWEDE